MLAACALAGSARAAPALVRVTAAFDLDDIYDARAARGGVDATRMAEADFGSTVLGRSVVVDALNGRNKSGEAPRLANRAYDADADLLMDMQSPSIMPAVTARKMVRTLARPTAEGCVDKAARPLWNHIVPATSST